MPEFVRVDDRFYVFSMSNAYEHYVLDSATRDDILKLTPVWGRMLEGYFYHSSPGDTLQYSTNGAEGFHLSITRKV